MEQLICTPLRESERDAVGKYVEQVKAILKSELHSIVLFGSVVKDNYFPGSSDINLLVLVREMTPGMLVTIAPIFKGYAGRSGITTLFLDTAEIRDASDVFPIMCLDIGKHHIMLYGSDLFEDLILDRGKLRLDLERQLRTTANDLRRQYISSNYTSQEIRTLLVSNFSKLSYLLGTLLELVGMEAPIKKEEIVREASVRFALDLAVFQVILELKKGVNNLPKKRMQEVLAAYLRNLDMIVEVVDKL